MVLDSWAEVLVLAHPSSREGRQVEHVLPAFTQEKFLHRPLLLHEQHNYGHLTVSRGKIAVSLSLPCSFDLYQYQNNSIRRRVSLIIIMTSHK